MYIYICIYNANIIADNGPNHTSLDMARVQACTHIILAKLRRRINDHENGYVDNMCIALGFSFGFYIGGIINAICPYIKLALPKNSSIVDPIGARAKTSMVIHYKF